MRTVAFVRRCIALPLAFIPGVRLAAGCLVWTAFLVCGVAALASIGWLLLVGREDHQAPDGFCQGLRLEGVHTSDIPALAQLASFVVLDVELSARLIADPASGDSLRWTTLAHGELPLVPPAYQIWNSTTPNQRVVVGLAAHSPLATAYRDAVLRELRRRNDGAFTLTLHDRNGDATTYLLARSEGKFE